MQQCRKSLNADLFILNDHLRPALLELRLQCETHCQNMLMAAIEPSTTYTLEEFKTCHFTKMQLVGPRRVTWCRYRGEGGGGGREGGGGGRGGGEGGEGVTPLRTKQ